MEFQQIISPIKESFEYWYNDTFSKECSIVINYSDVQTLAIKAFHTATIEVVAISNSSDTPKVTTIITVSKNYNHGDTTEEDAQKLLIKEALVRMYNYKRDTVK